jgi:vacuolar-type H+-ATPase subunit E/Vma4
MAPASVYHLAEIDQMIARLRADLRDISERAVSAAGSATEDRLADMLSTQEERLRDLLVAREDIVAKAGPAALPKAGTIIPAGGGRNVLR